MRLLNRSILLLASVSILASCGGKSASDVGTATASTNSAPVNPDMPAKIGGPYKIGNVTYTPADVAQYDDVGYAGIYGGDVQSRNTANGEIYLPQGVSVAHKTLPLPTYVEITALDTGRTILARVNDRGPFAQDRLIDLSEGAARQLGILGQGIAGVRVRKVNPQEQERSALRNGGTASIRTDTPESLLRVLREKLGKVPHPKSVNVAASSVPVAGSPVADSGFEYEGAASTQVEASDDGFVREGATTAARPSKTVKKPGAPYSNGQSAPVKAVASTKGSDGFVREGGAKGASAKVNTPANTAHYIVQIASYASRDRADKLAKYAGASVDASADGKLFRVRYGPYDNEEQAKQVLATALNRGYRQARLFRD